MCCGDFFLTSCRRPERAPSPAGKRRHRCGTDAGRHFFSRNSAASAQFSPPSRSVPKGFPSETRAFSLLPQHGRQFRTAPDSVKKTTVHVPLKGSLQSLQDKKPFPFRLRNMPKAFSPDGQREMSSVRADAFPLPERFPGSFSLQGEFTASDCLPASILPTVRLKTATACFHRHISCCSAVLHCSCVPLFSCSFMPPFSAPFQARSFPLRGLVRKN